jgi:hypothetical protein
VSFPPAQASISRGGHSRPQRTILANGDKVNSLTRE